MYLSITISCLRLNNQILQKFETRILHEYASEFTSPLKGELLCKLAWWKVKRFLLETHRRSAKHQRGLFHETESSQTFLKHAIHFADCYFLFHFNRTVLSVCSLIQCVNMLCIPRFNWNWRSKVKIFSFLVKKIGCPIHKPYSICYVYATRNSCCLSSTFFRTW